MNRARGAIFPEVYKVLGTLKPNEISTPIKVPIGYQIVKLNKKVPLKEANLVAVKEALFNDRRTRIFNNYFNGLKKDFKIQLSNQNLLSSLK